MAIAKFASELALVAATFNSLPEKAFSRSALASILNSYRTYWNLPNNMGPSAFIHLLLLHTKLARITLHSPQYSPIVRYLWGSQVNPLCIALSMKRGAYFSHGTAIYIHGLGGDEKHIFVNSEQSEKFQNDPELTQERIDQAFRNKQRISKLTYKYGTAKITILNGKNSGRLGVELSKSPSGDRIEVTSLERTLIDIVVRPSYAGGVSRVLEAYRFAREKISTDRLAAILKQLDYVYPYHQAVGFYMKRSGYRETDQQLMRKLGTPFHFYLDHGIKQLEFDPEFKVFFPSSLNSTR